MVLLTKVDVTISMKVHCLRHHMKNYAGCAGPCPREHSIAYKNLKIQVDHIQMKKTSYSYEFKQDRLFGDSLLDKTNWRFHRFLDSCAYGDPDKLDIDKLNVDDKMEQVERREYNTKVPAWIKKLTKKQESAKKP